MCFCVFVTLMIISSTCRACAQPFWRRSRLARLALYTLNTQPYFPLDLHVQCHTGAHLLSSYRYLFMSLTGAP